MTKRYNTPSRVPFARFTLLAAMLFYVSGAAWLVHIELDHAHGQAEATQVACDDAHGPPQNSTPGDAAKTPTKKHCQLCDMLTGSTQPMAVAAPVQAIDFADDSGLVHIPAESPASRLSAPGISRRGPPALG